MPFVPTYLTCIRTYVPLCLKLLRTYVPTCPHFSSAYVLTCLYIFFMYLRALNCFVATCAQFSCACVPTATHKIYWGSLLYLVLLFFSGLFDFSFHLNPQSKLLLLRLHTSILPCGVFVITAGACAETITWEPIKKLSKTMDSF